MIVLNGRTETPNLFTEGLSAMIKTARVIRYPFSLQSGQDHREIVAAEFEEWAAETASQIRHRGKWEEDLSSATHVSFTFEINISQDGTLEGHPVFHWNPEGNQESGAKK